MRPVPLLLALAVALAVLLGACRRAAPEPRLPAGTPVVLIVVDTLRADRLGCYGYPLETSPAIDALAAHAHVFEQNTSQCNATFPSLTSLMTGLYVRTHRNFSPVPLAQSVEGNAEHPALAELLRAEGYRTLAVVSQPAWVEELDAAVYRGWDELSLLPQHLDFAERIAEAEASVTNARTWPLLDAWAAEREPPPLFLWVHYFDPHTNGGGTYAPPAEVRDRFLAEHLAAAGLEHLRGELARRDPLERLRWLTSLAPEEKDAAVVANGGALYDAEVAWCDAHVGRLLDRLRELGLYDRALIVLLSDHGENLEGPEYGRGRVLFSHERVYEPVARVPLIVKLPGQTDGSRVRTITQTIDVTATVLELLGLPGAERMEGASLVPLLDDAEGRLHDRVFVESKDGVERALKTDRLKYVEPGQGRPPQLFDWRADPEERTDLAPTTDPAALERLAQALREFRPPDALRLRFTPGPAPRAVELEIELTGSRFEELLGPDGARLEADGRRLVWAGRVAAEPVELLAFPENPRARWSVRVADDGAGALQERVLLGRTPLPAAYAVPIWEPGVEPAPTAPVLALARDAEQKRVTLTAQPAGAPVELELLQLDRAYHKTLHELARDGFSALEQGTGMIYALQTLPGVELATVTIAARGDLPVVLARRGGRWPRVGELALDGRAVDPSRCAFVLPEPVDQRALDALSVAPELDTLPPASFALWLETGGVVLEIDPAGLDPERLRLLRALGYVR